MKCTKLVVLFSALTGLLASSAVNAGARLDCVKLPAGSQEQIDCYKQVRQELRDKIRERVKQRMQERAAKAAEGATDTADAQESAE